MIKVYALWTVTYSINTQPILYVIIHPAWLHVRYEVKNALVYRSAYLKGEQTLYLIIRTENGLKIISNLRNIVIFLWTISAYADKLSKNKYLSDTIWQILIKMEHTAYGIQVTYENIYVLAKFNCKLCHV